MIYLGADGHIFIYDFEKLKKIIPNYDPYKVGGYGIYKREIFGHVVITQYTDYAYHDLCCIECGKEYCKDHPEEKYKDALIDVWEVWT